MSIFFEDHKNIFELLKEDDGSDIINGGDAGASDADSTADNTTSNGSEDANDASSTTDNDNTDSGDDENFDIDTSLDDDSGDGDSDDGGDDSGLDDDSSDDSSTTTSAPEEAIPANKDILTTLTAEEQAIKIKEQKKQYNDMYIYIDDLIDKVGDIQLDEDNTIIIERITKRLYNLRDYLNEYITDIFATKDFISNDIFFNRFLQVLYSVDNIISELANSRAKKLGLELDETEKK